MQIIIHDSTKLVEIQELFSTHFPYLRLEFFDYNVTSGVGSIEKQVALWNKTLHDIRQKHKGSHMDINSHEKVSTFKKYCLDDFGIVVEVFRKSGNSWLQIPMADEWTLSEQNKLGQRQSYNWQKVVNHSPAPISINITNH